MGPLTNPYKGLARTFPEVQIILRYLESTGAVTGRLVIRKVPVSLAVRDRIGFEGGSGWSIEEVRG